ncbi:MAG TPA: hypothetical protein VEX40_13695 [Mycobacterium sp.]|nr:hypothetical protein [Mycobacterium sp.]
MATNGVDWLAEVLRAKGLDVVESAGPHDLAHEEANDAWEIRRHHPGRQETSAESIATGDRDLTGPLSHPRLAQGPW